jgi:hypothetical protein
VKNGGHDPRHTGRAIRAFAGEKAAAGIRLGEEALRERLLGFIAAGGLAPDYPAPLVGEQRLLPVGRQFGRQGRISLRHRLVRGGELGIAADRLLGRGFRLLAIRQRLRRHR